MNAADGTRACLNAESTAAATTTASPTTAAVAAGTRRTASARRTITTCTRRSAATAARTAEATAVRIEDAGHQRQKARVRARLENHGVATRLDRLRLATLERLVGRHIGQRASVDHVNVFDPGRARPTRAAAVGHTAGQDEPSLRRAVVREQSFRVRVAVRLVDFRDKAGAKDAFLFGDVDAVFDHAGPFTRTELDRFRHRRVYGDVLLRSEQLRQIRIVVCLLRFGERFIDHLLKAGVAEVTRVGAAGFLARANGGGDLAVVLHEVGGDRGVGPSCARPFTAGEIHFHGVGLGHIEDLVDDSFGFFASIHKGAEAIGGARDFQAVCARGRRFVECDCDSVHCMRRRTSSRNACSSSCVDPAANTGSSTWITTS